MGFSQYSSLFALVICLVFVGQLNVVNTSFVETIYTATLTPQQVQPDNGITDLSYNAAVICEYVRSEDPIQLDCEIQHNVGSNATSIQIKKGARGVNGPQIFRFNSVLEHVRNTFTFEDTDDFTAEDLQDDFLNGQFYIQVNTDSYPSGIIRGQIEHKDRAYARLNSQNTIPSSSGTTATGIALATYSFYSPANLLQIDVVHNIVDPTILDLDIGLSNQIGDVAYSFTNAISPVFDSVSLTITEKSNFFNDLLYLNFKSESNPTGDIRGALIAIDYPFTMSYTAVLEGSSEFTGGALVSYNCDTQLLEYLIIHNIPRATGAFLGQGSSSSDGTPLFSLSTGDSPIYGSLTLPSTYLSSLTSKQLYLQVVKGSDSSSNIKGQISGDLSVWSYLSGTNELPAISTNNEGLALFTAGKESNSKRQIQYQIYHSVPKVASIDIRIGSEGNTGPIIASLDDLSTIVNGKNVTSPLTGSFSITSSDYNNYFLNSAVYIEITTKDFPLGLLRGQINELAPCVPNDSPETIQTASYNVLTYFDSFYPTLSVVIIASSNAVVIGASFILMFISLLLTI